MSEEILTYLWDNVSDRFLAEGAIYRELRDLKNRIRRYDEWPVAWMEVAHATKERAERLLQMQNVQTAADDLRRAAIYYFFSQFLLWDDYESKKEIYGQCFRTFRIASKYFDAPQVPIEIPYGNIAMSGYLRLPPDTHRPPCVLLLNGLDTTKEEQYVISTLCVQRGLATISFDGPGQGETFYRQKMSSDYVEAVHAALDFAEVSRRNRHCSSRHHWPKLGQPLCSAGCNARRSSQGCSRLGIYVRLDKLPFHPTSDTCGLYLCYGLQDTRRSSPLS